MKNRRNYADGYMPKNVLHISQRNTDKVNFFTKRHEDKYGKLTAEDVNKVIDMVTEIALK